MLLQIYWTSLIFRAVWKQMKNGVVDDIRSDDESGDEVQPRVEERKIARKKSARSKKD